MLKTKSELINDIAEKVNIFSRFQHMGGGTNQNVDYQKIYAFVDEFIEKIKDTKFIEPLPEGWFYNWNVSFFEAEVSLECKNQKHSFLQIYSQVYTAEEYSAKYGMTVSVVTQIIRRGRMHEVYKKGNRWYISSFIAENVPRGYSNVTYTIRTNNRKLLSNFSFAGCESIEKIDICKKKKNNEFELRFRDNKNNLIKTISCTNSERFQLELFLLEDRIAEAEGVLSFLSSSEK